MKEKKEISVYFANWNLDRLPAEQAGEVAGIPWDCVTNIKHAFWQVTPADGSTETSFERRDRGDTPRTEFTIQSMWQKYDMEDLMPSAIDPSLPRNHFAQYDVFAKRYPDVEIMLSIGGWARCGYFSEMAYTRGGRRSFIQSCMDFLKKHTWASGIDAGKLCIGTPFYALVFKMKEMNPMQVVGAPCETYRASSGIVTERDLKEFEAQASSGYRLEKDGPRWQKDMDFDDGGKGWHLVYDKEAGAAYAYNDEVDSKYYKWFLSYENHLTLQKKLDYINDTGVGGIIIWEVDQDTQDYAFMNQIADHLLR